MNLVCWDLLVVTNTTPQIDIGTNNGQKRRTNGECEYCHDRGRIINPTVQASQQYQYKVVEQTPATLVYKFIPTKLLRMEKAVPDLIDRNLDLSLSLSLSYS